MAKAWKGLIAETKENIVPLIDHGWKVGEVSKLLQLNRSTVGKVYKYYRETGSAENRHRFEGSKFSQQNNVRSLLQLSKKEKKEEKKVVVVGGGGGGSG